MQENNNGGKFVEQLAKKGAKKIAVVLLPIVPWIVLILAAFVLIMAFLSPVAGFIEGVFSIFDQGTGELLGYDRSTFSGALLLKEQEWKEKGVAIDKELILSIALYSRGYDIEDDIPVDCEDPTSDDCVVEGTLQQTSKQLIKDVEKLADGMVKERIFYSCRNKIVETHQVCGDDGTGESAGGGSGSGDSSFTSNYSSTYNIKPTLLNNFVEPMAMTCWEEETISWSDPLACGYDDPSLCDSVCTPDYQLEQETVYELKTKEEYIAWLKLDSTQQDEFNDYGYDIEQHLRDLKFSIPNDPAEKAVYIDEKINEMYQIYYSVMNATGANGGSSGSAIISAGLAGPMPSGLIENLLHPLGSQTCSQSACFGVYSSPNCTGHIGVDLVSNGSATIYSVAAGTVVHTTRNSTQCNPSFAGGGRASCGTGCEGITITIRHEVVVDGQTMVVYSKYAHLAELYPRFKEGETVVAGEPLGIMGTTGCSTGVHLHFELMDANKKNYNPEELLQVKGCSLNSSCEAARQSCGL